MNNNQQKLEAERKLAWAKFFREKETHEHLKSKIIDLIKQVNSNSKTFICEYCLNETDYFLCEHGNKFHRECFNKELTSANNKIEELRELNRENKEELKNLLLNPERTIGITKRIKQLEKYIKGYTPKKNKTCLC